MWVQIRGSYWGPIGQPLDRLLPWASTSMKDHIYIYRYIHIYIYMKDVELKDSIPYSDA